MQPLFRFSIDLIYYKTSLFRSQILNYTTVIHFFGERGGRFVDMQSFQIYIPEVAFHLSPVY